MYILINIAILLIAVLHGWFLILEMFLWQKPLGLKTFQLTNSFAAQSAPLAANQGLYNGFLSAGLFWSLLNADPVVATQLKIFFLGCIALAGIYGSITVNKKILWIEGFPAIVVLILLAARYLNLY